MKAWWKWLRQEQVLCIAWILAILSAVAVPPDGGYGTYVDGHTLGLLFALMAVMAGLGQLGLFRYLGERMLTHTRTTRQLEGVLLGLPFLSAMVVTNDVALITFVPFALEVLCLAHQEERIVPVVVMQTIGANLGSMATPIGNPQNLYLYSSYGLSPLDFLVTTLPYVGASLGMLVIFLWVRPSHPLEEGVVSTGTPTPLPALRPLGVYVGLFVLCLATVAGILPLVVVCPVVAVGVALVNWRVLLRVDYALLLTFVGFFIFVGNLGRVPAVTQWFQSVLQGREVLVSVAASQVISNVPAALLLSGFTEDGRALVIGTNLGGLGTLIASMASLISYKYVSRMFPQRRGVYLVWFTALNVLCLGILLGVYALL